MYKGLLEILEEYFYPLINHHESNGINGEIERYEECYNLLFSLLDELDKMGKQAGSNFTLPSRWDDKFDEYFDECIAEYIMNSDDKADLLDGYADKYIPFEHDYCSKCGIRCYFGAYPEAINNNGKIVCEICEEEF